tara:strand:+ start:1670 stop:1831 length:162 start_codon:yes stop_codon:yes gene_type:complete
VQFLQDKGTIHEEICTILDVQNETKTDAFAKMYKWGRQLYLYKDQVKYQSQNG